MSKLYSGSHQIPAMRYHNKPSDAFVDAAFNSGEWVAQEKVDGAWYMLEKIDDEHIYLFGRTLSKKTGELTEKSANVPHIVEWAKQLPDDTVLIGEIYVPGGKSNDVTKIMGCTPANAIKRQQSDEYGGLIHYYIFDCIRWAGKDLTNTPFIDRWNYLLRISYNITTKLSYIYDSDFDDVLSMIFTRGGEGMVFKRKDSIYEPDKRPQTCFKMKEHVDSIDLICMELLDPEKEYTGKELETWQYWEDNIPVTKHYYYGWKNAMRLGAYKDGKIIEVCRVASGLTDEIRADMADHPELYLMQVIQISCMSLNKKDKTIRHPVFETVRTDKDIKDCQLDEIFG